MTTAKPKAKSLADFRAAHDRSYIVPTKIKAVLAALGDEGWLYELELCKEAGVSVTDLSAFRESFEAHIVTTAGKSQKRVWFGNVKTAAKARAMT